MRRPLAVVLRSLAALPLLLQHVLKSAAAAGSSAGFQSALFLANVVMLSIAMRRMKRAQFAAAVRCVQQMDREGLQYLLHRHLPLWVKFADWERADHLQSFIDLAWPTFNRLICSIIKREIEERLGSHGEFGRVSFARLSFGRQPPMVMGVKGVPLRDEDQLAMVIDIDVRWAGEPDVLMQLSGIPGAAIAVRTCQVSGCLRLVLSPIEEELPFLTGISLSLLERPHLDFDIRLLGGDVMSLPALGSWLRSSVAGIVQERLVWPESLGWRWGPSWERQREAASGGAGRALLAREQQRRRQLPPPLGVLLVEVVGAELEPRRSTFLGRLKPVSSRLSLLLPAAASGPLAAAAAAAADAQGGGDGGGGGAARAVLQKGLTGVQGNTCHPAWSQTFAFVVSSRHQVLHLLLSHKRSGVLAKGMVQALGADVPLGSADIAVADIIGEAAAQEEWSIQQMLYEAAQMEVAAARAVAAAAGRDSDADSSGDGYQSAADEDTFSWMPASPGGSTRSGGSGSSRSRGLAAKLAAAAAVAAAGGGGGVSDEEEESGVGRWVLERRSSSVSASAAAAAWQAAQRRGRQGTPPPKALSLLLERELEREGSVGSPVGSSLGRGRSAQWRLLSSGGGGGGGSSSALLGPHHPYHHHPLQQQSQSQQFQSQLHSQSSQQQQLQAQHSQRMLTPPVPARTASWRRSATRSPSPDIRDRDRRGVSVGAGGGLGLGGAAAALLDPAALMALQMEQRKPEVKWLAEEGVWLDVSSTDALTLAGLLAQAAQPAAAGSQRPGGGASGGGGYVDGCDEDEEEDEDEDGWLSRMQRYILGQGGEEDEEFAPTQAPLAGKLKLRLRWQAVEEEAPPAPLLDPEKLPAQQGGAAQQRRRKQQQQQQGEGSAAVTGHRVQSVNSLEGQSPLPSARASLDSRTAAGGGGGGGGGPPSSVPATPRGHPLPPPQQPPHQQQQQRQQSAGGGGGSTSELVAAGLAAVAAAAEAAAAERPPQRGVLAVRVAHTKLDYASDLSYPVLAVSMSRGGGGGGGASTAPPGATSASASASMSASAGLLAPSPSRASVSGLAGGGVGAGGSSTAPPSVNSSPSGLASSRRAGEQGAPAAANAAAAGGGGTLAAEAAVAAQQAAAAAQQAAAAVQQAQQAAAAQQAQQQRWISMDCTAGSRMGLLHWGQVFYMPLLLGEADCQEAQVCVELGEVASATRFNLFGPALYSLDAYDSFGEDVKVTAAATIPLRTLLQQRRQSGSWRLKEATAGVAEPDCLDLGRATVQLAWFPLQEQAEVAEHLSGEPGGQE